MGRRADRHDRHIHGGDGHFHRQRRAAAHRRRPLRRAGRIDVGAHQLPGRQRDRPAHQRVAQLALWPQALLHVVRVSFHGELVPVRTGAEPEPADLLSRATGRRRGRPGTQRAGHHGGHFSRGQARHGVRGLRNGRRARAGHRSDARRLDHRPLQLALDFLHQRSLRHPLALSDQLHGAGPAAHAQGPARIAAPPRRFHRHGAGRHRTRRASGSAR